MSNTGPTNWSDYRIAAAARDAFRSGSTVVDIDLNNGPPIGFDPDAALSKILASPILEEDEHSSAGNVVDLDTRKRRPRRLGYVVGLVAAFALAFMATPVISTVFSSPTIRDFRIFSDSVESADAPIIDADQPTTSTSIDDSGSIRLSPETPTSEGEASGDERAEITPELGDPTPTTQPDNDGGPRGNGDPRPLPDTTATTEPDVVIQGVTTTTCHDSSTTTNRRVEPCDSTTTTTPKTQNPPSSDDGAVGETTTTIETTTTTVGETTTTIVTTTTIEVTTTVE